jgi:hypothetical protein
MRARWMIAGAVALLVLSGGVAVAQGRGQNRDKPQNRGQAQKAQRQAASQPRFNDHDRQVANNWYYHERRNPRPGFRDSDRLRPEYEARLQPGYVIDPEMRRWAYAPPVELVRGFTPAPPGYRYMVIGGHLVLVDVGYRVADVFRLEINLGR